MLDRLRVSRRDTRPSRESGKTGPVLDAIEALFLKGKRQLSIHKKGRGGIAVIGVQPQNVHAGFLSRRRSSMLISTSMRNQNACMKWKIAPCLPSRNPSLRKYRCTK